MLRSCTLLRLLPGATRHVVTCFIIFLLLLQFSLLRRLIPSLKQQQKLFFLIFASSWCYCCDGGGGGNPSLARFNFILTRRRRLLLPILFNISASLAAAPQFSLVQTRRQRWPEWVLTVLQRGFIIKCVMFVHPIGSRQTHVRYTSFWGFTYLNCSLLLKRQALRPADDNKVTVDCPSSSS